MAMSGLECVLIIITTGVTIIQILFAKLLVILKVLQYTTCSIIGICYMCLGSGHYGSFADLTKLPLIPYEFNCNGHESSLLDCTKYKISCYYSYRYYYYYTNRDYYSVTCQQDTGKYIKFIY